MPISKGFPKPFKLNHGKLSDNERSPFKYLPLLKIQ